jgi:hypothetical protein
VFRLATSHVAPLLGKHLAPRVQARLQDRTDLGSQRSAGRAERVLTTGAGDVFKADVNGFPERHRWGGGPLDDELGQLFSCLIRPGNWCVDVGAGFGLHTVRMAKLTGPTGEVIAVEPDPERARRAAQNIALNGLANVRVIRAAASGTARPTAAGPADPPGPEPTITIDGLRQGPVALLRIGATGRAPAVVTGAAATIDRDHPAIVVEYAPEPPADSEQGLFGRLAGVGYLLYRISSQRRHLTGRGLLRLGPVYAQPETRCRLLAVSEDDAPRIISLVAFRDSRR